MSKFNFNFKSLVKNRLVQGFAAIVLAVVISITAFSSMNANNKTTDIIRVKSGVTVDKGKAITSEDVETITVGEYNLPSDTARTMEEVVGKFALTDLVSQDYILTSKLTDEISTVNEKLHVLEKNKYAYALHFSSLESSLANKIISGDIVSVVATEKTVKTQGSAFTDSELKTGLYGSQTAVSTEEYKEPYIPFELQYVKVLSTTTGNGVDKENANDVMEENLTTVILEVSKEQLLKLKELENNDSNPTCAFVCRGDNNTLVDEYLELQNKAILEANKAKETAIIAGGVTNDEVNNSTGE